MNKNYEIKISWGRYVVQHVRACLRNTIPGFVSKWQLQFWFLLTCILGSSNKGLVVCPCPPMADLKWDPGARHLRNEPTDSISRPLPLKGIVKNQP